MDEDKPLLIDLYFGGARSKGFALFRNTQVAFGFPEVASELVRDIFEIFDLFLFLFIILARNIDCKSILQKTSKQFGLVLQNTSENRHTRQFSVHLTSRASLPMSRDMFLQSAFQFGFLPSKP